MHKSLIACLTALTAALVLSTAVGTATAGRLSTSHQTFRVTWREINFGGGTVVCELTLEGSFHGRSIAKVPGSLIGYINVATLGHPCPTGEAWADNGREEFLGRRSNQSLPWHITYEGFGGTLPRITGVDFAIRLASFVAATPASGSTCLGRYGSAEGTLTATISLDERGVSASIAPIAGRNSTSLRERLGGFFCPATGALTGTGVIASPAGERITVTLI